VATKLGLECGAGIKEHNYFILEAISRWYFAFLIDKNGDQEDDQEQEAIFTS